MLRNQGSGGFFSSSNPQDSFALIAPIFGTKGSPDRHIGGLSLRKTCSVGLLPYMQKSGAVPPPLYKWFELEKRPSDP